MTFDVEVLLKGTMSAGNHVSIERDYTANGTTQHSRLELQFDARLSTGAVSLPGIPILLNGVAFRLAYWREVTTQ